MRLYGIHLRAILQRVLQQATIPYNENYNFVIIAIFSGVNELNILLRHTSRKLSRYHGGCCSGSYCRQGIGGDVKEKWVTAWLQQPVRFQCQEIVENTHYSDVIMSAMAFQITGVSIVCLTVCPGEGQRKHQSSVPLAFVRGIHRWAVFPSQKTSNAENVSIYWRHREIYFRLSHHKSACKG